jgi:hypothetical protein
VIVVLASVLAELCGPVPAEAPDPNDAASYVQVGDEAAASGDARVAAIAYRKALAHEPDNAPARAALDKLCREDRARIDDTGALLVAIAQIHAGDLDDARQALREIVSHHGASEAGARFFLGLVALQEYEGGLAVADFERAAADPLYAGLVPPLLRLAHRTGVLSGRILIAPEIDTNPQLLPDTPPVGAAMTKPELDGDVTTVASATLRPLRWLVLRDVVSWRQQVHVRSLDLFNENLQAGIELVQGIYRIELRDELDYDLLAGDPYLLADRAVADLRHDLGGFALAAMYTLQRREYQRDTESAFTGWVHRGDAGVVVHVTPAVDVDIAATIRREVTSDPLYAYSATGAVLGTRARLGGGVRLAAVATGWYARYDGAEPDGSLRRDWFGEVVADVELDLNNYTIATCGATAIGNTSTIDDFHYRKLVVRCGLALEIGGP